jgi:hypothetical protein
MIQPFKKATMKASIDLAQVSKQVIENHLFGF